MEIENGKKEIVDGLHHHWKEIFDGIYGKESMAPNLSMKKGIFSTLTNEVIKNFRSNL